MTGWHRFDTRVGRCGDCRLGLQPRSPQQYDPGAGIRLGASELRPVRGDPPLWRLGWFAGGERDRGGLASHLGHSRSVVHAQGLPEGALVLRDPGRQDLRAGSSAYVRFHILVKALSNRRSRAVSSQRRLARSGSSLRPRRSRRSNSVRGVWKARRIGSWPY